MGAAISMRKVYEELKRIEENMATKKEIESLVETLEVMGNPDTVRQIKGSVEDVRHGRTREVNSANDLIGEI